MKSGFVSVVANELTKSFERLDRVFMRVGALPQFPSNFLKYNLTWSTDGLSLTYHLKTEPRWSDGEPFTARDVVVSYELYVHPDVPNPRSSNFDDVESVTAVDDSTVVFRFTKRSPEMTLRYHWSMRYSGYNLPTRPVGSVTAFLFSVEGLRLHASATLRTDSSFGKKDSGSSRPNSFSAGVSAPSSQ